MNQALEKLYAAEKPLAVVEPSERDANVLRLGSGGSRKKGDPQAVTQLVVSAVQWSRVARLLERKLEVEVELDVRDDVPRGRHERLQRAWPSCPAATARASW